MATNPMSGFIAKYKSLPDRALNAIQHPIDTLESALGIPLGEPPEQPPVQSGTGTLPPQWEAANRAAEQQALAQQDSAAPRRKPIGKQATGY